MHRGVDQHLPTRARGFALWMARADHIGMMGGGRGHIRFASVHYHGNLHLVGHRAKVNQLRFRTAVRRLDQRGLISQGCGTIGQRDGFPNTGRGRRGNQQFIRGRVLCDHLPYRDFFFRREQRTFTRRAANNVACERSAVPFLNVVLYLDLVDVSFVVEWRRDVGVDSLKFHPQTMFSLYLECRQEEKDGLIAELWGRGSSGITESDLSSGGCGLRAFFEADAHAPGLAHEFSSYSAHCENEEPRDWVAIARSRLEPQCVGSRFFLVPEWRDDPTPQGRFRIEVNPGMAFGTGAHESTQLCLEA